MCVVKSTKIFIFINRDATKPINVLTGLDYWLDNLMCNVPELVMCYHIEGIVQVLYHSLLPYFILYHSLLHSVYFILWMYKLTLLIPVSKKCLLINSLIKGA